MGLESERRCGEKLQGKLRPHKGSGLGGSHGGGHRVAVTVACPPSLQPAVYAGEVERRFPGSLTAVDQDGPRELQAALPGSAGVTFELCAGLLDQPGLSLEEVACKEAWEECGYRLAPSDLRRVATYK